MIKFLSITQRQVVYTKAPNKTCVSNNKILELNSISELYNFRLRDISNPATKGLEISLKKVNIFILNARQFLNDISV